MFHKKRKHSASDTSDPNSSVQAAAARAEERKAEKKASNSKLNVKAVIAAVVAVIAAAAIAAALLAVSANQGLRKSQKLAKKIGELSEKAASSAGVELVSSSDFRFINELCRFSSLAEASGTTRVYDVTMPSWTIFCSENSFGKLESVTYCDFRVLSSNINGIKKKSKIDTSGITTGSSASEVDAVLGMKPYQTVYSENSVSRQYKYFYIDKQSGETKAYYLTVIFGSDNKVNSPVIVEENNFLYDILKFDND